MFNNIAIRTPICLCSGSGGLACYKYYIYKLFTALSDAFLQTEREFFKDNCIFIFYRDKLLFPNLELYIFIRQYLRGAYHMQITTITIFARVLLDHHHIE